jgi:hypothetical protein
MFGVARVWNAGGAIGKVRKWYFPAYKFLGCGVAGRCRASRSDLLHTGPVNSKYFEKGQENET